MSAVNYLPEATQSSRQRVLQAAFELFVNQGRLDVLRALDQSSGLRIRVNCFFPVNYEFQQFGIWFGDYRPHQEFSPMLRVGGVKVFADSAWTNKMYMTEPHVDQPGYRGEVYWAPDELTRLYRTLHDDGWSLATHTCGDAAHDMVLDAYQAALAGADNAQHRHRIDHLMAVRDDQVQRMVDLGILASFQLTWFTSGTTPDVEGTLGKERLPWVGRWRDLLAAGVPAVASTDYPWVDLAERDNTSGYPMKALSIATTRSVGISSAKRMRRGSPSTTQPTPTGMGKGRRSSPRRWATRESRS